MKQCVLGLVFCICLIAGFAIPTKAGAEEFYTYKDPDGKLVISNKLPPPGSVVLKRQELPEFVETAVQPPRESSDPHSNKTSPSSSKLPETNI